MCSSKTGIGPYGFKRLKTGIVPRWDPRASVRGIPTRELHCYTLCIQVSKILDQQRTLTRLHEQPTGGTLKQYAGFGGGQCC